MRMRRSGHRVAVIVLALAVAGCGGDSTGVDGDDLCGNAAGNGNEIVSGPSEATGDDHDQPFRSLAIDPANPAVVFVGTERNGIVRSRDGGLTWERVRQGLRHLSFGYAEVFEIAIAPARPALLIAGTSDSPGPLTGSHPSAIGGVYRSTDGGVTWQRANCGLANGSVASVRFLPGGQDSVVIGVSAGRATFSALRGQLFTGGLYRSTDRGQTWAKATAPEGAERSTFTRIRTITARSLLAYATDFEDPARSIGFLRSGDGGANWQLLEDPLGGRAISEFDVSGDGTTLYVNSATGFRMLRSQNGGTTWAETTAPVNGVIAASPRDGGLVLFEDFGTLRRSTDHLASYTVVVRSERRFDDIEFAPSNPDIVYAVTEGYDVYRSDDAGATFRLLVNLRATVLRESAEPGGDH